MSGDFFFLMIRESAVTIHSGCILSKFCLCVIVCKLHMRRKHAKKTMYDGFDQVSVGNN